MGAFQQIKNDITEAFAAANNSGTNPYDTDAEVVRVEGNTAWVHIPGGVDETPVEMSINAKAGDNVRVRVAGGQAWMTGNTTAPPTDDTVANAALSKVRKVDSDMIKRVNGLDKSLTQEEIIKRITNNYEWQGIYLDEDTGNYYFNATYIHAGEISADYIRGGTLTLGGSNNSYGKLVILNARSAEIGVWDKDGIDVTNIKVNEKIKYYSSDLSFDFGLFKDVSVVTSDESYNKYVPGGIFRTASNLSYPYRLDNIIPIYQYQANSYTLAQLANQNAINIFKSSASVSDHPGTSTKGWHFCMTDSRVPLMADNAWNLWFGTSVDQIYANYNMGAWHRLALADNASLIWGLSSSGLVSNKPYAELRRSGSSSSYALSLVYTNTSGVTSFYTLVNASGTFLPELEPTNWVTNGIVNYQKIGKQVVAFCNSLYSSGISASTWITIGTLPTGYRPSRVIQGAATFGSRANYAGTVRVNTNGTVQVYCNDALGASVAYCNFNITFGL